MNAGAIAAPAATLSFAPGRGQKAGMTGIASFRTAVVALAAALLSPGPSLAQTSPPVLSAPAELTGAARSEVLTQASRALDGVRALQGRFQQVSPNGATVTGVFYLQRPGRLRFEYDPPSPLTIIADGASVAISDKAMRTTDQMPLRATPLYLVLKSTINLEKDARITRVARTVDEMTITARDKSGQADGEITLSLDATSKALKRWRIVDGQGQVTQLTLLEAKASTRLDPKLFVIQTLSDPTSRRKGG